MNLFKNRSLLQQFIILFSVSILIPVIFMGYISYFKASRNMQELISGFLSNNVKQIKNKLDASIDEYDKITVQLSARQEFKDFITLQEDDIAKRYAFHQWLRNEALVEDYLFANPYIFGISIIGDNGSLYTSGDYNLFFLNEYRFNSELVKQRNEFINMHIPEDGTMGIILNTLSNSKDEEIQILTMARRIYTKYFTETKGTFAIDIRAEKLNKIWEGIDIKDSLIYIIDANGNIIHHRDHNIINTKFEDSILDNIAGKTKGNISIEYQGEKHLLLLETSERTGWNILVFIPHQSYISPIDNLKNAIIFSCIIFFSIGIVIGINYIIRFLKPLKMLEKCMMEIENENWIRINEYKENNELGKLIRVYNNMVAKISNLIEKVYKVEFERKEAQIARNISEFQALQMQINPHFIYNTLGTISSYALINGNKEVELMVDALGDMLRYAVQNPLEKVSLEDEICHVKSYLQIQSYRQEVMPNIFWKVADEFLDYKILRLTIQPLVENIFQHAFPDGITEINSIWIRAYSEKNTFIVEVSDNGVGPSWDSGLNLFEENEYNKNWGIGLRNVYKRLQIAYSGRGQISIIKNIKGGTTVTVTIPLFEDSEILK